MGNLSTSKGRIAPGHGNDREPKESGTPATGLTSAPKGEVHRGGPGPGTPGKAPNWKR